MATEFGSRLRAAYKHSGKTQKQIAKEVGMGQGTLSDLMKEGRGSVFAMQLAHACGVNPDWLVTGAGLMLSAPEPSSLVPAPAAPSQVTLAQALEVVARSLNDLPDAQRDLAAQHLQTLARAPDSAKAMQALLAALHCHAPPMPLPESRDFQPPVPPSFLLKNKPTEHHS